MKLRLARALTLMSTALLLTAAGRSSLHAQGVTPLPDPVEIRDQPAGPYDAHVLAGGPGLTKPIPATSHMLRAAGVSTLSLWTEVTGETPANTLLAGVGDPEDPKAQSSRFLALAGGHAAVRFGAGSLLVAPDPLRPGWHFLAAVFALGQTQLYIDGKVAAEGALPAAAVAPVLQLAPAPDELSAQPLSRPPAAPAAQEPAWTHFGGMLLHVELTPGAQTAQQLELEAKQRPEPLLGVYEEAATPWPVQTRGQAGYTEPQNPELLPTSKAPFRKPIAQPLPNEAGPALQPKGSGTWVLANGWKLTPAPGVNGGGATVSAPGVDTQSWMRATVPGTILTTMVDRGVYPDPDFGLNNLAIPETLARQDYWYRLEFATPKSQARHFALTFNGINYAAEVWLNGQRLGDIRGAFIRGQFDVGSLLRSSGDNVLAVRISPPPHPGIPEEESIKSGPGENGGAMCLDGPTFVATEGWDWIPAIRDRNSGLWQDVELTATDQLRLGDPQVITKLPLPDVTSAAVTLNIPIRNLGDSAAQATLRASFEGVELTKQVSLPPGETLLHLTPADFPELTVRQPRLWWPNGYGRPDLYHLKLAVSVAGAESDHRELTFGIREVTYELSLFDSTGHLRRVEVSPTAAAALQQQVVDVTHEGMLHRAGEFYAASLTPAGEHSSAVTPVTNEPGLTDLVLKVNGVRIAARGGNWGMDDSRKRVSREHLEPFFRLHREANLNIIRNWVGQNTEEVFYQLADEYGLMVWNDFWASTQNYNVEPQDVPLFLNNARDVVRRFRNHPSIVIWCGRNEGVPQPVLNEGLIQLLDQEDGTRYYTPGSNRINLRNSGPYSYQEPAAYYSLDKGFSVELGTASLSTLESLKASIAPPDQWPVSDAWAYHDWHQLGNGRVEPFMRKIDQEFGAGTSLKDFERKAQMLNYVNHRAIFEGFFQHLWRPSSGRMIWMTQPAWPSNMWQLFSSDYDTQASFYGVKKACEPLHAQLDLSDYTVAAVNTTDASAGTATMRATVYSLDNRDLFTRDMPVELTANGVKPLFTLPLREMFDREGVVLVRLQLTGSTGTILSTNTYWLAGNDDRYRKLNTMPPAQIASSATQRSEGGEDVIALQLTNTGQTAAIETKATLFRARGGERILPAYFSDNYVALLPGESVTLTVRYPAAAGAGKAEIHLRGWNVPDAVVPVR